MTDRNDLDDELFATVARCAALFGETPEQAEDVAHLKSLLARKIGGLVFTTPQKFKPEKGETEFSILTERSDVIVFVDEAHRPQYGFAAKMDGAGVMRYGFTHPLRRVLPNAAVVGFAGTLVELVNTNACAIFGDKIDAYDIA
ncbi:hypothetical protein [Acuticoccus mangrovi]|uniref:hypothetical protein n=1 Tax=Acuticoccus mangrovi TaxID=2796142 RepID=UPI001B3C0600|nr:hypothetical protein [Acuticoccus mangrovi]